MTNPTPPPADLPTPVVTVDLSALAHNVAQVRQRLPPSSEILAVVKADAYGHGAVVISRTLVQLGIPRLGVANLQEGIALREAGISAPILVMGALFANQFPDMIAHRLTPVIYDHAAAAGFAACTGSRSEPYPVHVKVDTGMGRLGLSPDDVLSLLQSPPFRGPLRVEGLMTHLADADSQDPSYTQTQITRFSSVISQLEAAGFQVPLIHAANSAAILCHPSAHFTVVRPGIMLYGYHTTPLRGDALELKVRRVAPGESISYGRTFIASRLSRIAVLPIGYADGYSRALSNRGAVLIAGRRAPVVGRVCMDMTMVDVTDIPTVRPGHEAVLIGRQGDMQITAADLAAWLGTIPYEVLCSIGPRVIRRYSPNPCAGHLS